MKTALSNTIKNTFVFGLVAVCLLGCTVSHAEKPKPADTVTFSGEIKLGTGRSASVDTGSLQWIVSADNGDLTLDAIVNQNTKQWSMTVPTDGSKWTVAANGILGRKTVYSGETDVIADTSLHDNVVINVQLVSGLFDPNKTGHISLPFVDESGRIVKVIMETISTDPENPGLTVDASVDFDEGRTTLNVDLYTGQHIKTFDFIDGDGNVLYQCRELITVFADCTTDTWIGQNNCIAYDSVTGKNVLKITKDLIANYGTECVPNTSVLLYEVTDDKVNYYEDNRISITDSSAGYLDDDKLKVYNRFCFDNSGDMYILKTSGENENVIYYRQSGNQTGSGFTVNCEGYELESLAYDRVTKTLYGKSDSRVYEIPVDSGSTAPVTPTKQYILCEESLSKCFAVNNGVVYTTHYCQSLYMFDLSNDAEFIEADQTYEVNPKDNPPSLNIDDEYRVITDILYQDGCVYMLLRENVLSDSEGMTFCSRGAIIKYDLITKSLDDEPFGWTEEPLPLEYEDVGGEDVSYLAYLYKDGNYIRTESDNTGDYLLISANVSVADESLFNLYVPETIYDNDTETFSYSKKAFYGPQRFIAIRPKQLVISDEGMAFYVDELGAYRARNVNRIVTVDLESFAIEELPANVAFDTDVTDDKISSGNESLSQSISSETTVYYSTSGTTSEYGGSWFCGSHEFTSNDTMFGEDGKGVLPVIPVDK